METRIYESKRGRMKPDPAQDALCVVEGTSDVGALLIRDYDGLSGRKPHHFRA